MRRIALQLMIGALLLAVSGLATPIPITNSGFDNDPLAKGVPTYFYPIGYDPGIPGITVPAQREMEKGRSPLVSIPPCGRGFSRHPGLPIRCDFGKSAKGDFRARLHRLDEPTRLSLGVVASPQSPLPFHLAESL